jgi:hypothetical protein
LERIRRCGRGSDAISGKNIFQHEYPVLEIFYFISEPFELLVNYVFNLPDIH